MTAKIEKLIKDDNIKEILKLNLETVNNDDLVKLYNYASANGIMDDYLTLMGDAHSRMKLRKLL